MPGQRVEIRLFGTLQVARGDRAGYAVVPSKVGELLAILLLAPEGLVQREVAAESLSPGSGPETSRKALRQALWHAHQLTEAVAEPRLIEADAQVVRLNPDRAVWSDVTAFRLAVSGLEMSAAEECTDATVERLTQAAALHQGTFLPGCYEDWCLVQRERLDDMYLTLLDRLSMVHERRGDLGVAIAWARALLVVEPAHERTHRRLMRLHYLADDRTRALRQYQRCRWVLEHDLNVAPSVRTQALAAAIEADADLAGRGVPASRAPGGAASDRPPVNGTAAIHVDGVARTGVDGLESLRGELMALRASVDAMRARLEAGSA